MSLKNFQGELFISIFNTVILFLQSVCKTPILSNITTSTTVHTACYISEAEIRPKQDRLWQNSNQVFLVVILIKDKAKPSPLRGEVSLDSICK